MDTELLRGMFLRARDQYESATRWAFIVILLCILFHLMTFSQFVSFGKQLSQAQTEKNYLSSLDKTVAELTSDLKRLEDSATKPLNGRINNMLDDLSSDFDALDRSVAQVSTRATSQFTVSGAGRLLDDETTFNMTLQMDARRIQDRRPQKVFELSDELRRKIRTAGEDVEELRKVLLPVIEEQIVHPRFDQLNTYWHDEVLPKVKQQAAAIEKKLQKSQSLFPGEKAVWDEVRQNVEQTAEVADNLKFQTPTDANWWTSISGKMARLSGIAAAAEDELSGAVSRSKAIVELSGKVKAALNQQRQLQGTLQKRLKTIEEDFKKQQAKVADLSKPFGVLAFDLNAVVSKFPLLLGIVLAAVSIWPTYRCRELASMVDFMAKSDQAKVPWEWLIGRLQLSERRQWMRGIVARCLIYFLWIGIATWQLAGWEKVNPKHLAAFAIAGCLAVAAAQGYRWSVNRQVLALCQNVSHFG